MINKGVGVSFRVVRFCRSRRALTKLLEYVVVVVVICFTPKRLAKQCLIQLPSYLDYSKSLLR